MSKKTPPPGRPFKKGKSGNPKGRPPRSAFIKTIRDLAGEAAFPGKPETWRELIQRSWFMTAMDRRHRDHMMAVELFVAYDEGRPVARAEVSGPHGGPIVTTDGTEDKTSQQVRRRLEEVRAERDKILEVEAKYLVKATKVVAAVANEDGSIPKPDDDGTDDGSSAP